MEGVMPMQQSSRQEPMVLELGPVPTAAAAGRGFVRDVCGRWELAGLADPAALVANELVTNAVTHAGTALELRVELHGRRLEVAVQDQDPNLPRVQAARDGTGRGFGLLIVDRVAVDWGVRPGPAGGKTVWCALELPPPEADPGLVWTKLRPQALVARLLESA
jgi:signal transduction histidine kinase